jgi:hypothetical protein
MEDTPSQTPDDQRDSYRRLLAECRRHLTEGVDKTLAAVYMREIAKIEAALKDLELKEGRKTVMKG